LGEKANLSQQRRVGRKSRVVFIAGERRRKGKGFEVRWGEKRSPLIVRVNGRGIVLTCSEEEGGEKKRAEEKITGGERGEEKKIRIPICLLSRGRLKRLN